MKIKTYLIVLLLSNFLLTTLAETPVLHFKVSMPEPTNHRFLTEFNVSGIPTDTVVLHLPKWTPGYYQLLDYAADVKEMKAFDQKGAALPLIQADGNTWKVVAHRKPFKLTYLVVPTQTFVARSYLDAQRGYLVPANNFPYIEGWIHMPVSVEILPNPNWTSTVTGLKKVSDRVFSAPDFDILYDCPILMGNLTELPAFEVNGIKHRFVGYDMGTFDGALMMRNLKKFVVAATSMFGDIPYSEYTFIGIGQGNGGIEHLNNTTVSFKGDRLTTEEAINDMILYLGHEYFHHYNVKRIRPFELGPFDYDRPNRTTQLWVSEGLTMYYQYVLAKRAGLMDGQKVLDCFSRHIKSVQNNPARLLQSMTQSSYGTWEDGPFTKPGQTISYYEKGPLNGLILDLAIRRATKDEKSLDDAMKLVYDLYCRKLHRGFTDAEFQNACETMAGIPLTKEFEYVTTTKEMDYAGYLDHLGLELVDFRLQRSANSTDQQAESLKKWMGER